MKILGISCYYHDSAAALVVDGTVTAAAQEERFSRKKHDERFPKNAIAYCLSSANVTLADLDAIVFYDKPLLKFERLLETYLAYAPRGFASFVRSMPIWLKDKLFLKRELKKAFADLAGISEKQLPELLFAGHHQSHAASAFYPSPFENAAVLCLDGVGEWATTTVWEGRGNRLRPLWEIDFPHSLGLLYSTFTYYAGFKVNSGEYKLMGLAPYGRPAYKDLILKHLIDLKEDGTFRLDMSYFNYATGLKMTGPKFDRLFGGPARASESALTQREMDLARSIQEVTEEIVLRLARTIHRETGLENLCLAGGVALNCVANGRLLREGPFKELWIQPASGDAGGALGAALVAWHEHFERPRTPAKNLLGAISGSYLGPAFTSAEIASALARLGAKYERAVSEAELLDRAAAMLEEGKVIGWFQGRMEFGPRALGNRSIVGDARNTSMQSTMNLKIKFRESFRPFAPAVLAEDASATFDLDRPSPYMLLVAGVRENLRLPMSERQEALFGIDKLNVPRSSIPAVTHVDYSARVQTVHAETNPRFHGLISAFKKRTGCGTIVNTSFNVRGEPIVCTPEDAYRCFMRTEMDALILEDIIVRKQDQPDWKDAGRWREEFTLD